MPASAQAYELGGRAWPGGVVVYYETLPPSVDWSVAAAARAWNTSGANVRCVRVTSASRAQLIVRFGPVPGASARATLGYARGAHVTLAGRPGSRPVLPFESRCARAERTLPGIGACAPLQRTVIRAAGPPERA